MCAFSFGVIHTCIHYSVKLSTFVVRIFAEQHPIFATKLGMCSTVSFKSSRYMDPPYFTLYYIVSQD
jgi:hypothetical protein